MRTCSCVVVGLLAGLALPAGAASAEIARGVVYEDLNANGVRDAGEPGVSGVGVSDGERIVETGVDGAWSLEVGDEAVIFVIQPRGYRVPTDANRVPRFSYVHKPAGSPAGLEFAGVAPTGPMPASIDFGLRRVEEPARVRFAVLGDPQVRNEREIGYMQRDVVETMLAAQAGDDRFDAVLALGDIMFDDLDLYDEYDRVMGALGVPIYNVHGNHDLNFDVETDELSDETWERVYGPATYSFDFGPAHVVVIDNVLYLGESRERGYWARIGERSMAFLRATLARQEPGTPIVVAVHIPIQELSDLEEFLGVLGEHEARVSLSAHWHQQRHVFLGEEAGWTGADEHHSLVAGTACGSWWSGAPDEYGVPHAMMRCGAPIGWTALDVDASGYRMSFHAAGRPSDAAMHLHAPVALRPGEGGEVVANVWFAGADDRVQMRVDGGQWRPMRWDVRIDPYFAAMKEIEAGTGAVLGRDLPSPRPSEHIWVADLPTDMPEGGRVVEVRWTDRWGEARTGRTVVRVEP